MFVPRGGGGIKRETRMKPFFAALWMIGGLCGECREAWELERLA